MRCSKPCHPYHNVGIFVYFYVSFVKIISTLMLRWWIYQNFNPVNYKICTEIQQRVCLRKILIFFTFYEVRCDGKDDNSFNANSLLNPKVKEFWKSANSWQSYERKMSLVFFDSQCTTVTCVLIKLNIGPITDFSQRFDYFWQYLMCMPVSNVQVEISTTKSCAIIGQVSRAPLNKQWQREGQMTWMKGCHFFF